MVRRTAFAFSGKSEIHKMSRDNQYHSQTKEQKFILNKKLFCNQKNKSCHKKKERRIDMMMFYISMIQ
jgi:hypothetical protein